MNKYAEILYGKIQEIYEDERDFDTFRSIFSPEVFIVDVTGIECGKGYVVGLDEKMGLKFVNPNELKDIVVKDVSIYDNTEINELVACEDMIYASIDKLDLIDLVIKMSERIEILENQIKNKEE